MATDTITTFRATVQPAVPPQKFRFTVDAFARLLEIGIFTEDDPVELLDGELYVMSPQSSSHIAVIVRLTAIFSAAVGEAALVSVQNSLQLNDESQPQPDVVVMKHRDDNYHNKLPQPSDILLLVEVAHTSVEYDRRTKLPRYAAASLSEVWIVDTNTKSIEQYSDPHDNRYRKLETISAGERIESIQVPAIAFAVDELFSSRSAD